VSIAELPKLPSGEKLRITETLWADLAGEDAFESPVWHEQELKKTEEDFAAGRIEAIHWEGAKKEVRARFEK
jgi:hypothetical protein